MKCYICQRIDKDVEAVALQSERVSVPQPATIEGESFYIPVCEEHKSDSTDVDMVIPLPNDTEESYQRQLVGAIRGMDIMQANLNNSKTTIEKLKEQVFLLEQRLIESRESLEASETIREELDIEIAHIRSQIGEVLKFVRQYFTTYRFPGLENHTEVSIKDLSDSQLIKLIRISKAVLWFKLELDDFVCSLD